MWKCGTFILLTLNILLLIAFYIINNGYSKKESLLTEKVNKLFYENISLQDNIILSKQGYCQLDPEMLLYTKDRDHTTGGKVGLPTGSMVNAADRLGRP